MGYATLAANPYIADAPVDDLCTNSVLLIHRWKTFLGIKYKSKNSQMELFSYF